MAFKNFLTSSTALVGLTALIGCSAVDVTTSAPKTVLGDLVVVGVSATSSGAKINELEFLVNGQELYSLTCEEGCSYIEQEIAVRNSQDTTQRYRTRVTDEDGYLYQSDEVKVDFANHQDGPEPDTLLPIPKEDGVYIIKSKTEF